MIPLLESPYWTSWAASLHNVPVPLFCVCRYLLSWCSLAQLHLFWCFYSSICLSPSHRKVAMKFQFLVGSFSLHYCFSSFRSCWLKSCLFITFCSLMCIYKSVCSYIRSSSWQGSKCCKISCDKYWKNDKLKMKGILPVLMDNLIF